MVAAWVNIAASKSLVAELNEAFPDRDRTRDGTIGDLLHQQESSDHNPDETGRTPFEDADDLNEVHALDVSAVLGRPGWTLFRALDVIRARSAAGQEVRVQNMICAGRITSRTWGFRYWTAYGGKDPHIEHGHVSFRYGSGAGPANPENITVPWGILALVRAEQGGDDMPTVREIIDGMTEELNADTPFARAMRRVPWQYTGGGLPVGVTALHALAAAAGDQVDEAALATALAGELSRTLPAGTLTGVEVEAAVRNVLRAGVDPTA